MQAEAAGRVPAAVAGLRRSKKEGNCLRKLISHFLFPFVFFSFFFVRVAQSKIQSKRKSKTAN